MALGTAALTWPEYKGGNRDADTTTVRLRAGDERRPRRRTARTARARGPARRRRPLAAADDEAAPRSSRAPDRHQRPRRRPLVRPGRGRRAVHRCDDPACRPADLGGRRRALPHLPRRRTGHRRSDRPQPRHDRRLAGPGRSQRRPLGRVRRAAGRDRHPGIGRHAARCRHASSTSGPTRRWSARPR